MRCAQDLRTATQDVRELGTEAVMGGGRRVVRSARFRVVARLGMAIARLAGRFRVFARAQERSIEARDAAARTRGMFFASVSHDLKSPLNAILGFTEIVRAHPVTPGQAESLALIERRGRELLALIETILDAARVEAGQLALVLDTMDMGILLHEAVARGRDLGGDRPVQISVQTAPGIPPLRADRVRLPRAVATFVAYAVREAVGPSLRIVATAEPPGRARIDVEVPSERLKEGELESVLDPARAPGTTTHRGLSLALRLGRAIVELHGGTVELDRQGRDGHVFVARTRRADVATAERLVRVRGPCEDSRAMARPKTKTAPAAENDGVLGPLSGADDDRFDRVFRPGTPRRIRRPDAAQGKPPRLRRGGTAP